MTDKTNNKNPAEKPDEVNVKPPSDFHRPSKLQPQESCQDFDGNLLTTYSSNILNKFTVKQANIMGNFAEVLRENQSKNINRISTEIGKHLNSFNENLSAYKANRSSGVTTISVNSNKRSTEAAIISVKLAKHISKDKASGEEDRNSGSSYGETDMRKAKRNRLSFKCQKSKTHIREPSACRQPPEVDELSLYGGSDLYDQIEKLFDTPHFVNAKGVALKRVKRVMIMTLSNIENDFNSVEQTR